LIIGQTFGITYEIINDNQIEPIDIDFSDDVLPEAQEEFNNQELWDDNSAQKLSFTDIHAMKELASTGELKGTEIIETIKNNSTSFDKRSEFSKAKYLRKKKRK
jgi:tRNA (adenine-N(1)-)-methyltransferase non-catalytic subunit